MPKLRACDPGLSDGSSAYYRYRLYLRNIAYPSDGGLE